MTGPASHPRDSAPRANVSLIRIGSILMLQSPHENGRVETGGMSQLIPCTWPTSPPLNPIHGFAPLGESRTTLSNLYRPPLLFFTLTICLPGILPPERHRYETKEAQLP